ncbi:hypothetical protein AYO38_05830 [bacterium SCGC AG-212-C10]|nr:hypothetical protein AYO38_05830 [bacterium SCGC AG-212-C10]
MDFQAAGTNGKARPVVAVIDVGSNSVRLLVARQLSPEAFEVVDEERFDARLGENQRDGALTPEGIARGMRAMRIMYEVAQSYAPSALFIGGTEALRRAPNAADFLDGVEHELGVPVQVLPAQDEAFASFVGAINSTTLADGHIVDIGGGSLEVMRVAGRQLVDVQSVPLGAIYATERYLKGDPPSARDIRALRKAVGQAITFDQKLPVLFGVGGAVRNIARIVRARRSYPLRRLHGLEVTPRELRRVITSLVAVPSEGRRKLPGVTAGRADILPAAAIVLDEVLIRSGATALTVSGQGLREGLVWRELRGEQPVLDDVRRASVDGLALANGVESSASQPVVDVAGAVFEATRRLHGLDDADLDLLRSAARLVDVGLHIDFYNRDRHAEYLIHSGDLHGFSHREIILIASIVRWASSGTPDLAPYKVLVQPEDARRVAVLAVLLGVARAIRRRTPSPVGSFSVEVDHRTLTVTLIGSRLDAELNALEHQARRLESLLRVTVTLILRPD